MLATSVGDFVQSPSTNSLSFKRTPLTSKRMPHPKIKIAEKEGKKPDPYLYPGSEGRDLEYINTKIEKQINITPKTLSLIFIVIPSLSPY